MKFFSINSLVFAAALVFVAVALGGRASDVMANSAPILPHDSPYDLSFIDMMLMHHGHGIEMAQLAESKSTLPQLKKFAMRISADQGKDTTALQRYRDRFYANDRKADKMRMGTMTMTAAEMQRMSYIDMNKLKEASGSDFNQLFIDIFTKHHQMAIQMSQDAQKNAEHAEVKEFARMTITKQGKDIREMDQMKRNIRKRA